MKYLITGGGTGGHIYPALAICKGIMAKDPAADILYVGTKAGFESSLVPREGVPFATIDSAGIMGKSPLKAAGGAYRATRGTLQAWGIVRKFRPDVALGTGGYVSGPVILVARMAGIPCAIQEQNAVPGFTNRLLGRMVNEVYTPFPGTEEHFPKPKKCVLTGNPVRPEILEAKRDEGMAALGLDPTMKTLFVFGGSRGARRIVTAALEVIEQNALPKDVQVLLVSGTEYAGMAEHELSRIGIGRSPLGKVVLKPYLHDIEHAFAASDLILGRAGGMTVSEVLARGLPSVLVPSPNVSHNHQLYNARSASVSGGAVLIREQDLTATKLADVLVRILSDEKTLAGMAEKARQAGRPKATGDIVDHLWELAKKRI